MYSTPAPNRAGSLYGTDLGWSFSHDGQLWVLFGDSWRSVSDDGDDQADDALGQISLAEFPDGASVDAFIAAHPAPAGAPAWQAAAPTLNVAVSGGPGSPYAPVRLRRDGMLLRTGPAYTPLTGFSNARSGAAGAAFGLFFRYAHVACEAGQCGGGFSCDRELGREAFEVFNPPCVSGASLTCVAGAGFCQDRGSSLYDASSASGRTRAVVVRHEIGVADPSDPTLFTTQAWDTQRFFNATARTVADFDPTREANARHDYSPSRGGAAGRDGVFIWGRPHFGGIGAEGRDAQLYLAWLPMPELDAARHFAWQPQFFAGLDEQGRPRFVQREVDSVPLDLDAARSGEQPEEPHDMVGQMAVSWVPQLERFVMIYGGGAAPLFMRPIFREDLPKVRSDATGRLFIRFAEQPWGPWTAPRPLLIGGDVRPNAKPVEQHAPGGILSHSNCREPMCARSEPIYADSQDNNNGVLYGPNIVDPWTSVREGQVHLYWFVSTWNPYQVVLMKTVL